VSDAAVVFDAVWKKFRRGERHDSLRDLIPAAARWMSGRERRHDLDAEEFWAVRDLSFKVRAGEALGIIGPNGAGKSTVLKLLTKILRPTIGACIARGRVGALIEVAAGFHPDLTGRENVFLQGAIMGMGREETLRKFDEIVEFSGISEFIDTPVKRYSSGMSARLGFSIAVHLDPDVLIVDEVLAVGDMAFQRRAFGKMREILSRDIAMVVVSHQLERVSELCGRTVLLRSGRMQMEGTPSECIAAYLSSDKASSGSTDTPLRLSHIGPTHLEGVVPGQIVTMRFRVDATDQYDPSRHYLTLRVRSAETGVTVTTTGTDPFGLIPTPGVASELAMSLQMNVGRGLYMVDTFVWDTVLQQEFDLHASSAISISTEDRHIGSAFLAPQITMRPLQ
jgi:ABC-type polysaccharide/polyol phosphate transport system ATPase subunit